MSATNELTIQLGSYHWVSYTVKCKHLLPPKQERELKIDENEEHAWEMQ